MRIEISHFVSSSTFFNNQALSLKQQACAESLRKQKTRKMDRIKSKRIATILLATYISALFFFCLYKFSFEGGPDLGRYLFNIRLDRYAHFMLMFPYPFIAALYLHYSRRMEPFRRFIFPLILISGFFLAALAESAQELFTSYRDTDPLDFAANCTGICTATLIIAIFKTPLKKTVDWIQHHI